MERKEFVVYALYSERYDKIYIGYSSNFKVRITSHNELAKKGWTIKYRPWKLVYTEQFATKSKALQREKQLKSYRGRQFIWDLIEREHK